MFVTPVKSKYIHGFILLSKYRQTSKISRILVGNTILFWSPMWIWNSACRHCLGYIFILDLTPRLYGLGKNNCKTTRETFKFWNLVRLILEVWRYMVLLCCFITIIPPVFTMTSQWVRWRLKSPASRLFTQQFIRAQIKENIKVPHHWPFAGNSPETGEFPAQMASNAENVSIWWRHHV